MCTPGIPGLLEQFSSDGMGFTSREGRVSILAFLSSFSSMHSAPAPEVHDSQQNDRTEQGDQERWQTDVVLVDGVNAKQGVSRSPATMAPIIPPTTLRKLPCWASVCIRRLAIHPRIPPIISHRIKCILTFL